MNAGIAGELIAPFVNAQWPSDKEKVWEILRLGVNKAWQEGKWLGMTAEFFVPVYKDACNQAYIMAPYSHPVLLAINTLNQHASIRDPYFMFHRNGYGDVRNSAGCNWNQDVYDLGSVPYFDKNNISFSNGVRIGARVIGVAGTNEKIWIDGTYADGNSIYTYKKAEYVPSCACCVNTGSIDTINGVEINLSTGFNYINNIIFTDIKSITKTVTKSPVEIIAIDNCDNAYPIGRMAPGQRFSKYRKYLVPNDLCGRQCLHALFKIGQQEKITSETDSIMISNEEALISLAIGIHNLYYIGQPEKGMNYIASGIGVLDKEKREEESPSESPVQVQGISDTDLAIALQRYH